MESTATILTGPLVTDTTILSQPDNRAPSSRAVSPGYGASVSVTTCRPSATGGPSTAEGTTNLARGLPAGVDLGADLRGRLRSGSAFQTSTLATGLVPTESRGMAHGLARDAGAL